MYWLDWIPKDDFNLAPGSFQNYGHHTGFIRICCLKGLYEKGLRTRKHGNIHPSQLEIFNLFPIVKLENDYSSTLKNFP